MCVFVHLPCAFIITASILFEFVVDSGLGLERSFIILFLLPLLSYKLTLNK